MNATAAPMATPPSLTGRALVAVLLMIGYYVLAITIAAALLYIPYAELVYAHRIDAKIALGCVIGAGAVLWSVLPRFDRFEAPGPQLTRDQHQRLFAELDGIAKSVRQAMPAEVYLVPDVNAWVAQRGGIMGFGSRRVMGLGLPLMRMLTRTEFRAVLAHEFGHFHGGDTKLGPWVYKTRRAISRTLQSLGEESWLRMPFLWYGKMFLRITHAVSRRQEFVADELAARAVGANPLISGLQTVHRVAPAFNTYWRNECAPVLNAGFRPPLTEGFRQFVQADPIAAAIDRRLEEELKSGKADPYDTHPPLRDRIAAVEHHLLSGDEPSPHESPATELLTDVAALEQQLIAGNSGTADVAGELQPIDWSDVCARVYLPQWTALTVANESVLSGITAEALSLQATGLKAFGERCVDYQGKSWYDERAERLGCAVVGAALTVLLVDRGCVADTAPGLPVSLTSGSIRIEPFEVLRSLAEQKVSAETWQRQCQELGIQGMALCRAIVA